MTSVKIENIKVNTLGCATKTGIFAMAMGSLSDVISRGAKTDPKATKILFRVAVALAVVALCIKLVADTVAAIIGLLLTIIAAVLLVIVVSISPQLLGNLGVWFARFCFAAFCVATAMLFTSVGWNFPKPFGCLIHPDTLCGVDFRKSDAFPDTSPDRSSQLLRMFLFPMGGALNEVNNYDFQNVLLRRGLVNQRLGQLLYDPDLASLRQDLVKSLDIEKRVTKKS